MEYKDLNESFKNMLNEDMDEKNIRTEKYKDEIEMIVDSINPDRLDQMGGVMDAEICGVTVHLYAPWRYEFDFPKRYKTTRGWYDQDRKDITVLYLPNDTDSTITTIAHELEHAIDHSSWADSNKSYDNVLDVIAELLYLRNCRVPWARELWTIVYCFWQNSEVNAWADKITSDKEMMDKYFRNASDIILKIRIGLDVNKAKEVLYKIIPLYNFSHPNKQIRLPGKFTYNYQFVHVEDYEKLINWFCNKSMDKINKVRDQYQKKYEYRQMLKQQGIPYNFNGGDGQLVAESTDELAARHASRKIFDKFDTSFINTGCGSQVYGWGIYVSTDPEVHQGYMDYFDTNDNWIEGTTKVGGVEYDVEIPDDNGHNYINWEGLAEQVDWNNVVNGRLRRKILEFIEFLKAQKNESPKFKDLYKYITSKEMIGMDAKSLSRLLSVMGYDGIKVPNNYNSGNQSLEGANYVIFNENNIQIKSKNVSKNAKEIDFNEYGIGAATGGEHERFFVNNQGERIDNLSYGSIQKTNGGYFVVLNKRGFTVLGPDGKRFWKHYYETVRYDIFNEVFIIGDLKHGDTVYDINERPIWNKRYQTVYPVGVNAFSVSNGPQESYLANLKGEILSGPYGSLYSLTKWLCKVSKYDKNGKVKFNLITKKGHVVLKEWANEIYTSPDEVIALYGGGYHISLDFYGNIKQEEIAESVINEVVEELKGYHASNANFDEFSSEFINTGCGSQTYGWGIYISTDPDVHQGYVNKFDERGKWIEGTTKQGAMEYDVEIPDDNGSNYLYWDLSIFEQINLRHLKFPTVDSEDILHSMTRYFGNHQDVTFGDWYFFMCDMFEMTPQYLSCILYYYGYDGISVSPYQNFTKSDSEDAAPNYVIFNPKDIKIIDKWPSNNARDIKIDKYGYGRVVYDHKHVGLIKDLGNGKSETIAVGISVKIINSDNSETPYYVIKNENDTPNEYSYQICHDGELSGPFDLEKTLEICGVNEL